MSLPLRLRAIRFRTLVRHPDANDRIAVCSLPLAVHFLRVRIREWEKGGQVADRSAEIRPCLARGRSRQA